MGQMTILDFRVRLEHKVKLKFPDHYIHLDTHNYNRRLYLCNLQATDNRVCSVYIHLCPNTFGLRILEYIIVVLPTIAKTWFILI